MTFALQNRANKDLQANLHALVERDPTAYGVVGWLSKDVDGERMEKLKREIEARESRRQKKGEYVGKGRAWTPERRAKFMRTVAERKSATLTSARKGGPALRTPTDVGEMLRQKLELLTDAIRNIYAAADALRTIGLDVELPTIKEVFGRNSEAER